LLLLLLVLLLLLLLLLLREREKGSPCGTLQAHALLVQQVAPVLLPPEGTLTYPQLTLAHDCQTPAAQHLLLLLMGLLLLLLLMVPMLLHA
jgi:hypothetical protein